MFKEKKLAWKIAYAIAGAIAILQIACAILVAVGGTRAGEAGSVKYGVLFVLTACLAPLLVAYVDDPKFGIETGSFLGLIVGVFLHLMAWVPVCAMVKCFF